MPTLGVVEPLNLVKDVPPGFVPRFVPGAEHSFDRQRREETLGWETPADAVHEYLKSVQQFNVAMTG